MIVCFECLGQQMLLYLYCILLQKVDIFEILVGMSSVKY